MTDNDDDIFQERVDELLLLEQCAEQRAQTLIDTVNDYQARQQFALKEFLEKAVTINDSLTRTTIVSEQIEARIAYSQTYVFRALALFLGSVLVSVLLVAGALGWARHIVNALAKDKAELDALNVQLKHTPTFVQFKGREYVRVVPRSDMRFTNTQGKKMPGQFAEVWHRQ